MQQSDYESASMRDAELGAKAEAQAEVDGLVQRFLAELSTNPEAAIPAAGLEALSKTQKGTVLAALRREAERADDAEVQATTEATSGGLRAKIGALFSGGAGARTRALDAEAGVHRRRARAIRAAMAELGG